MNSKGAKLKLNKNELLKAIHNNYGIISSIAIYLKVSRNCIYSAIKRFNLESELEDSKEHFKDYLESCLLKKVTDGDTTAIIFALKTKAKDRGYSEKYEIDKTIKNDTIKIEWI